MDNATINEDIFFEAETVPADLYFDPEHEQTLCLPHAANFTILCDNHSWHINKEVLCRRSKYFDLACNGPYLEATQSHMILHDDDPDAVHDMLTYLMYDSYGPAFADSAVDTHIAACDMADKYMLPGLQRLAVAEFKECMFQIWPESTPYDSTSAFAKVVERVYEDTRGLWEDPLKEALRRFVWYRCCRLAGREIGLSMSYGTTGRRSGGRPVGRVLDLTLRGLCRISGGVIVSYVGGGSRLGFLGCGLRLGGESMERRRGG
jgi:hypothetical protein